jgi:peptidyl-prolyl cis-trans isomerase B (cyclophilin B)
LDGDYTVFGQVIKGMDVVDAIVAVECDSTDAPRQRISLDVGIVELSKAALDSLMTRVL